MNIKHDYIYTANIDEAAVQVVAVRITSFDEEQGKISEFQRQMLAVHFMASRVVIPFVDCPKEVQERAHEDAVGFMLCTWPIQSTIEGVVKVLLNSRTDVEV
jgi:hypothetical protein